MSKKEEVELLRKKLEVVVIREPDGTVRYTLIGDGPDDFRTSDHKTPEEAESGDASHLSLLTSSLVAWVHEVAVETSEFMRGGRSTRKRQAS